MRILHIISGLNEGGAEAVLFRLCTFSRERAGDVVVSLIPEGVYAPRLRDAGIKVYSLAMPRGSVTITGLIELYRIMRATRADVVQTWMYHADFLGGLMAKFTGQRRVVWGLHNSTLDPSTTSRSTQWVVKACSLLAGIVSTRIISCSQQAKKVHARLGYPSDEIIVVPNGYNCDDFIPDQRARLAVRRELGLSEHEPLIGMVARFHPQKDHANLLDALAKLVDRRADFTCLLVGTGLDTENSTLAALIEARGLSDRIRLLGRRTDIPAIMNALDVHVLASATGEAFPNVVAEAMACGTPCVVTDVGDAPLIVDETGWVVPPRNSGALAGAIEAALKAREDATSWTERKLACRARIVGNFGLDKMVAAYETVWQQVARQATDRNVAGIAALGSASSADAL